MTHEEHRQRHIDLHKALEELTRDCMSQTSLTFESPIGELAAWSGWQVEHPSSNRHRADEEVHLPVIERNRG